MPDWIVVVLRTLMVIVIVLAAAKLLGKRQNSRLTFFEVTTGVAAAVLAVYITLSRTADWYLGIIALFVWILAAVGIGFLQMKSKAARDFIDNRETILIKKGKIMEENLKKERLTTDDLLQSLRRKNVFQAADVEFAVMEASGEINVLLKKENQPLTPKHLGIKVGPAEEPQAVIMDGKALDEPLAAIGFNRGWLQTELETMDATIDNVFLGQVDSYGELYVDLFDDKLQVPQPQKKAVLLAQIKKCEADIEMFGLSTNDPEAKRMFEECSRSMEEMISEIKPLLSR
ncbi:DUF421 domain-containing protein [Paenibacillus chitinolyticus]|uniref:DUF421 domain-containing protein n=1 Tax=Paenibacillus chitinolyticus TaxID=79263 RepID=UPI003641B58C